LRNQRFYRKGESKRRFLGGREESPAENSAKLRRELSLGRESDRQALNLERRLPEKLGGGMGRLCLLQEQREGKNGGMKNP